MPLIEDLVVKSVTKEGKATYLGESIAVFNHGTFARLQQKLEYRHPEFAYKTLYPVAERVTRESVLEQTRAFNARGESNGLTPLQNAMQLATERGFGKVFLDERFNTALGTGTVYVHNSIIARHYPKNRDIPVCYLLAGAIAGGASALFGNEFYCEESGCIATGEPLCSFDLTLTTPEKKASLLSSAAKKAMAGKDAFGKE